MARLKSQGSASRADVIVLGDAARLWRADVDGLFQPVQRKMLEEHIHAQWRSTNDGQGSQWFGCATRARVIVHTEMTVKASDVDSDAPLADLKLHGKLCSHSGSHPDNRSLFSALLDHLGPEKSEQWLLGWVANMARQPKGGDTDQIEAVASGECQVALTNSYYLARMMRSGKPEDRQATERIGVVMSNPLGTGTHTNIAAGAVAAHVPHRAAAVQFLEYLSSNAAQTYFAGSNNEWPAVQGIAIANPALPSFGKFKAENVLASRIGQYQLKVQEMLDRVGYK